MSHRNFGVAWLLGWTILISLGCSRGGSESSQFEEFKRLQQSNLKSLGLVYGEFMARNRGRPPADREQFSKFLRSIPEQRLRQLRIDDIDNLFDSPRDGEPMSIVYGKDVRRPELTSMPWIAFEPKATDGSRYVVNAIGMATVMEEVEFRETFPNAQ